MEDARAFEDEVKRIARLRWPSAENAGSEMVGGRERDGVFITEDCVHLIECTISRAMDKARKDLTKLADLYKAMKTKYGDRAFKCWFVTQHEPTADQRSVRKEIKHVPEHLFNIISFAQFRSKLIDSHEYLQNRNAHRFGSVYDPATGNAATDVAYISIGLRIAETISTDTVADVAKQLIKGARFTVLGEYGVGKSMTMRELFRNLTLFHRKEESSCFPIHLNLREHQGQQEPAEILERHARNIGFPHPSQIVRAWKAGFATLLIDGFDEVSSLSLQGAWRRLREARFASMAGVRRLVEETPVGCGIAIAGRDNFFDTAEERRKSLGQSAGWLDIRLDEFGEGEIKQLAKLLGFDGEVPSWIPSRPLLLATLFSRGMKAASHLPSFMDPAAGWDMLLDEVCDREARIESGITGENVRAILEAIATLARAKDGGLGPIAPGDIVETFFSQCGFQPTDESMIVLQRLPGLGRDSNADDGSRVFVDDEFADACRAGEFVRFCQAPFSFEGVNRLTEATTPLGATGLAIASNRLTALGFSKGTLMAAIKAIEKRGSVGATSADLVNAALRMAIEIPQVILVANLNIESIEVDGDRHDLARVTYEGCFIDRLDIVDTVTKDSCPTFHECLIQELDGRVSEQDLPEECFRNCVIEHFTVNVETTNAALDLEMPTGARVLVTILKKLFVQSISGRRENALYRGLDIHCQGKVPFVLDLLKKEGLIESISRHGEPIWIPVRRARARVLSILDAPTSSADPLVVAARRI